MYYVNLKLDKILDNSGYHHLSDFHAYAEYYKQISNFNWFDLYFYPNGGYTIERRNLETFENLHSRHLYLSHRSYFEKDSVDKFYWCSQNCIGQVSFKYTNEWRFTEESDSIAFSLSWS